MKRKPISQREARQLRKRVKQLEAARDAMEAPWARTFPGGTYLLSLKTGDDDDAAIKTARKLRHVIVGTRVNNNQLDLYAVPLPKEAP
ncbi:MAG TPA: hypothetical protein VF450_02955 [Noviherbaspirillum sp.]